MSDPLSIGSPEPPGVFGESLSVAIKIEPEDESYLYPQVCLKTEAEDEPNIQEKSLTMEMQCGEDRLNEVENNPNIYEDRFLGVSVYEVKQEHKEANAQPRLSNDNSIDKMVIGLTERIPPTVKPQSVETPKQSEEHLLTCKYCNETFSCLRLLRYHIRSHLPGPSSKFNDAGKRQFQCETCKKTYQSSSHLKRHELTHLNIKPYICNICSKGFNQKSHLIHHFLVHAGVKPFTCEICNRSFSAKSQMTRHKFVHMSGSMKPHACTTCGKTFTQKNHRDRHKCLMTNEHSFKKFPCDLCNATFVSEPKLNHHKRLYHDTYNIKLTSFPCNVCGRAYSRNSSLIRHKRIHSIEKLFNCDICKKGFNQKPHLIEHLRIHSGVKPHKCDLCTKSFTEKTHLTRHRLGHLADSNKPHACDVCNKRFVQKSNMDRHKLIHISTEKPYQCSLCSKGFMTKGSLRWHAKHHCPIINVNYEFKCQDPLGDMFS